MALCLGSLRKLLYSASSHTHRERGSWSHASQLALESLLPVSFLFPSMTIICHCPEWLCSEQGKPFLKTCGTFQHIKDLSYPLSWKDPAMGSTLQLSFLSPPKRAKRCTYSNWNVSYKATGGQQLSLSLSLSLIESINREMICQKGRTSLTV